MTDYNQRNSTTSIDQESITENSENEIEVSEPSQEIIGNFEDTSRDGWIVNFTNSPSSSAEERDDNFVQRGDYGWRVYVFEGNAEFTKTVDLTGYEKLIIPAKYQPGSSGYIRIFIAGNLEETLSDPLTGEAEIPLGAYSGSNQIMIKVISNYSGESGTIYPDNIRLAKNSRTTFSGDVSQ